MLDVACGGPATAVSSPSVIPGQLYLVALDQDPSAIAYLRSELLALADQPRLISGPIKHLCDLVPTSRFADVSTSSSRPVSSTISRIP